MPISIIHAVVGLLTFVVFLQTGWYMRTNDIGSLPDVHRMIYRAGHIYFLFGGLLNLSIGVQLQLSLQPMIKRLQYLGSSLLILSPCIFLYGFYHEASFDSVERSITQYGIFLSLAGTSIHSLIFLFIFFTNGKKQSS